MASNQSTSSNFFCQDLLNHLVIQTNLYARQFIEAKELKDKSRARDWTPTNVEEMKKFLGIVLLMGIVKLPQTELTGPPRSSTGSPRSRSIMTRNRFQLLLTFIHFSDNDKMPALGAPDYDCLYKIRPILDHLFERFQEVYEPRQDVCVDESLLLCKGRLIFRQYIPLKRARFGIKIYLCCESDGNKKGSGGYCYRFKEYAGKDDPVNEVMLTLQAVEAYNLALSASENMVMFLVAPLLHKGYTVYTDNWYSSLRLYLYLLEKATLVVGTVQENWGIPEVLHTVKLNPRESKAVCGDNKVVATKYHNTNVVHLMSTAHGHTEAVVADRRNWGIRKRPGVSTAYNTNMWGMDKQDQLFHPYDCTRKTMKWTKKLFFHFMQVAACNGFLVYKAVVDDASPWLLPFLESVITAWLWPDCEPEVDEHETDDYVRLTARHFCWPIPPTPGKAYPQKPCKVCWRKEKHCDTCFYCPFCPIKPGLCFPSASRTTTPSWSKKAGAAMQH